VAEEEHENNFIVLIVLKNAGQNISISNTSFATLAYSAETSSRWAT
jgi:hypothetical protein